MLAGKANSCRIAFIQSAKCAHGCIGDELHVSSRRDSVKALERSFLREPSLQFAGIHRVIRTFAVARDHTGQHYAPIYGSLLPEAQGLERDLKQHDVTAAVHLCFCTPDRVPTVS